METVVENGAKPSSPDASAAASATSSTTPAQGFVVVRIFGTFQASQCAQRRIQSLVSQSLRGTGTSESSTQLLHQPGQIQSRNYNSMSNHQIGLVPIANHYQPRGEFHQGQQRITNGGYNRHNRRQHHAQQNNNIKEQQNTSNSTNGNTKENSFNSGSAATNQQGTNGTMNNVNSEPAQSPSVSSSTQPQTPIIAATS